MGRPKTETKDILLSNTKNCETLIKQTHRKLEETMELKLTKPRETVLFFPPISTQALWMLKLMSLEVYNSVFDIREEKTNFELYTDTFDELSFEKIKGEVDEIVSCSNVSQEDIQDEII